MRYRHVSFRYGQLAGGSYGYSQPWLERTVVTVARPQWRPPADLFETDDTFTVCVEAAGMDDDDFDVTLYEDTLVVEGERRCNLPEEPTRFFAAEIRYGPMRLEVPVPGPISRDRVDARYDRGLLTVRMPKARRPS